MYIQNRYTLSVNISCTDNFSVHDVARSGQGTLPFHTSRSYFGSHLTFFSRHTAFYSLLPFAAIGIFFTGKWCPFSCDSDFTGIAKLLFAAPSFNT